MTRVGQARLKRGSECEPCAVAAPTVETQHFAPTLLRKLGVFVHAAAAHLLQSRTHDFAEISLRGVSMITDLGRAVGPAKVEVRMTGW